MTSIPPKRQKTASLPYRTNSRASPPERIAVVFDFDKTLSKQHMYRRLHGPKPDMEQKDLDDHDQIVEVFGGCTRLAKLSNTLCRMVEEFGVRLYIASHGYTSEIKKALITSGLISVFRCSQPNGTEDDKWLYAAKDDSTTINTENFIRGLLNNSDVTRVIYLNDIIDDYFCFKDKTNDQNSRVMCLEMHQKQLLDINAIDELLKLVSCVVYIIRLLPTGKLFKASKKEKELPEKFEIGSLLQYEDQDHISFAEYGSDGKIYSFTKFETNSIIRKSIKKLLNSFTWETYSGGTGLQMQRATY